jgi:hypothetical protein
VCLVALGLDALLLSLEYLLIDAAFVEQLEELLLLVLEVAQLALVSLGLLAGSFKARPDLFLEITPDLLALCGRQLDHAVVALDGAFDRINRQVPGTTAWTTSLVAETTEVLIDPTVATMATEHQPSAATAAEDRALEVVGVLLGAIPGQPVRLKCPLDLLEDRTVNDRLVTPVALDAPASHDPDVVIVAQYSVDAIAAEWFGWPLRSRSSP